MKGKDKLASALKALEGVIDDPMSKTRLGKEFRYDQNRLWLTSRTMGPRQSLLHELVLDVV